MRVIKITCLLLCLTTFLYASGSRLRVQEVDPGPEDKVMFLMLQISRDSLTGLDRIVVLNKIGGPGKIKVRSYTPQVTNYAPQLSRLPYLSFVLYKNNVAIDSMRQGYPLRERIQNTKETAHGYKDIEIASREFFLRFQQKQADSLKIFKVADAYRTNALISIGLN